jgi:toxin CptA
MAYGVAIALIFVIARVAWLQAIAIVAMLAHGVYILRTHVLLLGAHAVIAIEVDVADQLRVGTRAATWHVCEVLDSSYVMPYLTVLNLRDTAGGDITLVTILPDSLPADDFRKLRVWLRWKREQPAP